MTITQFLKNNRQIFSVSTLELFARVPVNTIAHAIGKEQRQMKPAHEDAIYKYLEEVEHELSNALVEYWQRIEQEKKLKSLPSSHGSNTDKPSSSKRQMR